jgi:rieske iron-sulfur protein
MGDCTVCQLSARSRRRRALLKALAGVGLGLPRLAAAGGDTAPPQAGDRLAFAGGERIGQPIAPADLTVGARQVIAFPQDPVTGKMRAGTRLNEVLVLRLDPASLMPDTAARAADGVVAYSAVCSHAGCDVTDWYDDVQHLKCPCHESEFDPADGAWVVGGPAPWQLAALPLKIADGKLAVAGPFEGRLGFLQPGQDPFGL